MRVEVATLDDNNQPTTLIFEGVIPFVQGDSLILMDEKAETALYGFNPALWSTFRVLDVNEEV